MVKDKLSIAKSILILIILVSLSTVLGVSAYLVSLKKTQSIIVQPTPKSTVALTSPNNEIANWQTYRNEKYGFQLEYPQRFIFTSSGPNVSQQAIDRGEMISGTVQPSYDSVTFSDKSGTEDNFYMGIFRPTEKKLSEKGYVDDYFYLSGPCDTRWGFEPSTKKMEKFNNIDVLEVSGKISDGLRPENFISCDYFKNQENNLIVLSTDRIDNEEDFNRAKMILQKALSALVLEEKISLSAAEAVKMLPSGAKVIEIRDLKVGGYPNRVLVLWMINPLDNPKTDDLYTCPEVTRGSYYSGPTRVSLVDNKKMKIINTLTIKNGEDSFDIPYKIREGVGPYYVGSVMPGESGTPTIMKLKDYNGDGKVLEFALFDSVACISPLSGLIGYSVIRDKVIQYPIKLTIYQEDEKSKTETSNWEGLFSVEPKQPGYWDTEGDSRGRGGCLEKQITRYDKTNEMFVGTLTLTDCEG